MKQLTKDEVQELFDFRKIRELKFYDLQLELVDHFASTMETNWKTYPNGWTFEQKIEHVYEDLSFKGFRSIVRGKSKMVFRKAYQSAFRYVKKAIKIPQIFLTIAFIYFLQHVFLTVEKPFKLFGFMVLIPQLVVICGVFLMLGYYYLSFKRKIYVFEQSVSYSFIWTAIPNYLIGMFSLYPDFPYSPEGYLLISILLVFYTIFCLASLIVTWKVCIESKARYELISI